MTDSEPPRPEATEIPIEALPPEEEATPETPAIDPEGETTLKNAELQKLLDQAEEAAALKDKLLRAHADMDNYRKRAQREKEDAVRYTRESVIEQLLPVIDNFDMGMQAVEQSHDPKAISQGMQMIHTQLQSTLKDLGMEEVSAPPGTDFDHNVHDAVGTQPSEEHPDGAVVAQTRKGYKVNGRLLRPASVYVAKEAPQSDG